MTIGVDYPAPSLTTSVVFGARKNVNLKQKQFQVISSAGTEEILKLSQKKSLFSSLLEKNISKKELIYWSPIDQYEGPAALKRSNSLPNMKQVFGKKGGSQKSEAAASKKLALKSSSRRSDSARSVSTADTLSEPPKEESNDMPEIFIGAGEQHHLFSKFSSLNKVDFARSKRQFVQVSAYSELPQILQQSKSSEENREAFAIKPRVKKMNIKKMAVPHKKKAEKRRESLMEGLATQKRRAPSFSPTDIAPPFADSLKSLGGAPFLQRTLTNSPPALFSIPSDQKKTAESSIEKNFLNKLQHEAENLPEAAYFHQAIQEGRLSTSQALAFYSSLRWAQKNENGPLDLEGLPATVRGLKNFSSANFSGRLMQILGAVSQWTADATSNLEFVGAALGGGVGALGVAGATLGQPAAVAAGAMAGGAVGRAMGWLAKNIIHQLNATLQARIAVTTPEIQANWRAKVLTCAPDLKKNILFKDDKETQQWASRAPLTAQMINYLHEQSPDYFKEVRRLVKN